MSGEDGNEEFYRQLQLQQQYEAEPGGEGESDPFTYVDPADGAAYEWDREKKAWFPKVGAGVASALPEGRRAGTVPPAPFPLWGAASSPRLRPSRRGGGLGLAGGRSPRPHAAAGQLFPRGTPKFPRGRVRTEEQLMLGVFSAGVSHLDSAK